MDYYEKYQQCLQKNHPEEALQLLKQHLRINRNHARGFFEAGVLLRGLGQLSDSLLAFLEACRLDPKQINFHINRGTLHLDLQQPEQAIQAYNNAYKLTPDPLVRYNRGMALLSAGCFSEGWQDFEYRIHSPLYAKRYKWHSVEQLWQGQPFPGRTLVVYHEQGLGDDIQFCRYVPYAKSLGGTVVLSTHRDLIPVFATLDGADQIIEHRGFSPNETLNFSWGIPLMSLPHLFHTTLGNIPNHTPYLSVLPSYRKKWQSLMKPYLCNSGIKKIGLVFSSANDKRIKSCPISHWYPLFSLPCLQWFSVQKGDAATTLQKIAANQPNIIDLTEHIQDFGDTAALLDQLDLLISIDTSVPHLAGALGKPVWLLLPFSADWRWMSWRSDSPWYPTFRLFRQPTPGQWESVIAQVKQALHSLN